MTVKRLINQILKFGVVGGTAFLIDYGLLFALTEFAGLHYLISGTISFAASVAYNYILSVVWVFEPVGERSRTKDMAVFLILSVVGLGINQAIMWVLVEKAAFYYMLSKIAATAIVMVYNFITRKLFLEGGKQ